MYPYKLFLKIIIEFANDQDDYNSSVINKIKKIYNVLLLESPITLPPANYSVLDRLGEMEKQALEHVKKMEEVYKPQREYER